jgi:OmpA-OmpF porin, OOP family
MKKRLSILIVIAAITVATLQAQTLSTKNKKAIELYQNADNYRVRGQYNEAIAMLNEALTKDKEFEEAYYRLALIYKSLEDFPRAVQTLEKGFSYVKDANRKIIYLYDLADNYLKQGNYSSALAYCDQFLKAGKADPRRTAYIMLWKAQSEYALSNQSNILNYRITVLSDNVNRYPMQYFPVITADNQQMIFTARFGGARNENEDLVISFKDIRGEWSVPVSLSDSINTIRREGACTISADGRHIIYTVCGERGCDLYESRKTGKYWSKPHSLGPNINSTAWDAQPSLSADGRELYFASDRKGGLGGYDIWYAKLEEEGWGKAQNLGPTINTPFNEISPYIHVNNQTLYIVSNGYKGYGGYDIYQVTKSKESWTAPVNMGKPLNDHVDQYSFIVNSEGTIAYYSREESKNRSRLYKIELPDEFIVKSNGNVVKGVVTDSKTSQPLKATLQLFDLDRKQLVSEVYSDSETGDYLAVLPGGAAYALYVNNTDYLFQSLHFNYTEVSNPEPVIKNVSLTKIQKDASIVLNNLFFDFDKYELQERSFTELNEIVRFLNAHPQVKIEIGGHTDNQGKEEYNQQLSLRRARSVSDYLINQGIGAARVVIKGYGSKFPINPNDTDTNRAQNRRIEFRIL